ncbi:MAG: hypothetical protein Q8P59_03595 [Dehalococcoidia bacterium]|nr:hypothetical protein [Dehalococcoidia bacterium]
MKNLMANHGSNKRIIVMLNASEASQRGAETFAALRATVPARGKRLG